MQNFKQWQPVEDFLLKIGKEADDEGTLNGGSSHGCQTVAGSPHRGHYNTGYADTNGSRNSNNSSSDMQDVNSAEPRGDTGASDRQSRPRTENLRALNKLAQQRYRERQRQKLEALQKRRSDYTQTLDSLHAAHQENKQLEAGNQKLEEQLKQLSTSDYVSYIKPSAPSSASENYSGDSDNSSTSPNVFPTRVGQEILTTAAHKSEYQKTEQAWFAKIEGLRQCMTELGYWGSGPVQRKEGLTTPNLMQLVGALEGVVELCCKVARMEGLEMNAILKRTELSCRDLQSWKEPNRWLTAARDVQLSEEQQQSLLSLRTACLDKLTKIFTKRQELSAAVVENLLPSDAAENIDPAGSGKTNLNQIMVDLEENLKEEQRFNCTMLFTVFKYRLNPVQAGWLILKSFPEHVDVLAFMNAVDVLRR